jgi:hypothetical protein
VDDPGAGWPLVGTGADGAGAATGAGPGLSAGGMYNGPVWPQPASVTASRTMARGSANTGFTIRITV